MGARYEEKICIGLFLWLTLRTATFLPSLHGSFDSLERGRSRNSFKPQTQVGLCEPTNLGSPNASSIYHACLDLVNPNCADFHGLAISRCRHDKRSSGRRHSGCIPAGRSGSRSAGYVVDAEVWETRAAFCGCVLDLCGDRVVRALLSDAVSR
jgi:hypothetical protein